MSNADKSAGFFGGFILGGIIGIIAGFLLSQKDEKSTLKAKFSEFVAQGRQTIREAIDEGKEAATRKESDIRADPDKKDQ